MTAVININSIYNRYTKLTIIGHLLFIKIKWQRRIQDENSKY